ncbi:MAG: hypothetical protein DMF97_02055 [Acidobacteria bacterium]|nr:MAG: hypothetical protein DMF97_02055 [Acidobacteriota bacterium]
MKRAFIAATLTWAVAMPFATFIAARSDASPAMYVVAVAVYGAGSIICHQLPGRTFHVGSAQMPVCARCTGIYAGAAMAAAVLLTGTGRQSGGRTRIRADRLRVLAAALPTVATLLFEWSTGSTPSNTVRALAGFPLGAAVAWVIGAAL